MFIIILAFIKRASRKKRTGLLAIKSTACARVIRLAKHTKGHFLREEARTGFLEIGRNFVISESLLPIYSLRNSWHFSRRKRTLFDWHSDTILYCVLHFDLYEKLLMRVKMYFYLARPRLCTSPILGTTPPNLTPYFFVPIQPRPNKSQTTFFLQKSTILKCLSKVQKH